MAITLSEIVYQHTLPDGRTEVKERHVDHLSKEYFIEYTASVGANITALLAQHAIDVWNCCVESEITGFVDKLELGTLPDPSVIQINYANRLEVIKALLRWLIRHDAVNCLKGLHVYTYIKNNYTAAQIATALGVSVTVVNAVLARFNILDRDLKPLLEADATKVTEL